LIGILSLSYFRLKWQLLRENLTRIPILIGTESKKVDRKWSQSLDRAIRDLSILETGNIWSFSGLLGNIYSFDESCFLLAAATWQRLCKWCIQHIPSIHGEYKFSSFFSPLILITLFWIVYAHLFIFAMTFSDTTQTKV
jgi:hypothetical protein